MTLNYIATICDPYRRFKRPEHKGYYYFNDKRHLKYAEEKYHPTFYLSTTDILAEDWVWVKA